MLGGIWEVLCCIQRIWRKCKNPRLHSSSGVIVLITAHSITVRAATFCTAWFQLTGCCLCRPSTPADPCRHSSGPCWPNRKARPATAGQTFQPPHVRGSFRNKDSAVIRLFIQKFRKKENTRNSQIHISGWRKKNTPWPIYRWENL